MKKILPALLLIVLLMSCAVSMPTPEEIANLDYGTLIDDSVAIQTIQNNIMTLLKDPESARFRDWRTLGKFWIKSDKNIFAGYGYIYEVNAKNAMGGYVGFTRYIAGINSGHVFLNETLEEFVLRGNPCSLRSLVTQ